MLNNIHIKNIALIEEADIDPEKGLNIMTGETGSGKSIMISSVNMALGEKANKSLIRSGAASGLVELVFTDIRPSVLAVLDELGISRDGNDIIITRKISADSSISRINGENVSLANLKKITSMLVDIHGQHDHQSLLDPSNHIDILDRFGGASVSSRKDALKADYLSYRELRKSAAGFSMDAESLSRETELLEHEKNDIEEAALIEGEDDQLEAEFRQLEKLREAGTSLNNAYSAIADEENGTSAKTSGILAEIQYALKIIDPEGRSSSENPVNELSVIKNTLSDVDSVMKDLQHDLEKYLDKYSFDVNRYIKVRDRLDQINRLKSRYGNTVNDILVYYDSISKKLIGYQDYNRSKAELAEKMSHLRSELNRLAGELSEARKKAAARLEPMIRDNLKELNFLNVEFAIDFKKADKISDNGFDRVEFMISMNPGEKLMPLAKVASGGELSRIMLAIKSSVADKDDMPTLIFDEIDTGISGKTAQMVAHKLYDLSKTHQIICITHLPQIASMADTLFSIRKEVSDGVTISGAEKLNREGQLMDIARLLGGIDITEASINNAADLKSQAAAYKKLSEHSDDADNLS